MDTGHTLADCVQFATLIAGRLTSRNPLFVLRLPAPFLLRLAERSLAGLLLKDPPRKTRFSLMDARLPALLPELRHTALKTQGR